MVEAANTPCHYQGTDDVSTDRWEDDKVSPDRLPPNRWRYFARLRAWRGALRHGTRSAAAFVLLATTTLLTMGSITGGAAAMATTDPAITLSPTHGPLGTVVTVTGHGWPARADMWVNAVGSNQGHPLTADSNGAWTTKLTITNPFDPGDGRHINYIDAAGSGYQASATFTVDPPHRAAAPPTPHLGRPAAPNDVIVTGGHGLFVVQFTDRSDNETAWQITNGKATKSELGAVPGTGRWSRYYWVSVPRHTWMCFRVRAYNPWGASDWNPNWKCAWSK